MHRLGRAVRFSLNPFLADEVWGFNSFASEPCGEGLAVFLELVVELCGQVDERTGFVVNVSEIDEAVRTYAVPVFAGRVREEYRAGRAVGFWELAELLRESWAKLADKFGGARVTELSLKVNPFRKIAIKERRVVIGFIKECEIVKSCSKLSRIVCGNIIRLI